MATSVISIKLNEEIKNVYRLEIVTNDLRIEVKPFSGVERENTRTKNLEIIETPLPIYQFDLPRGPYKLSPINGEDNGMKIFYDIKSEIPRKLRGKIFGFSEIWSEYIYDTETYITQTKTIEFREPLIDTTIRVPFMFGISYNYEIDPNFIKISLPL
jgi:hypothetical protein